MTPVYRDPSVRFAEKVRRGDPDQCWIWTGATNPHGYGVFNLGREAGGRTVLAHVYAFTTAHGPLPEGKPIVMHSCDNPPCCNQAHLSAGTMKENTRDSWAKGRSKPFAGLRGERHPQARLTAEIVMELRRRAAGGEHHKDLARELGVHPSTVSFAVNGETWGHLPGALA